MFDALFNWSEIMSKGVDATTYLILAAVGSILFLVRLAMALIGGDTGDGDADLDAGGNSDMSFSFFSVLSILAFFMGTGWMGLACRFDWELGRLPSAFIAAGFGFVMMMAASGLAYGTRRLNKDVGYDVQTSVGATGKVYLTVPPKGEGHGQVEVTVSGRRKVMEAVSTGVGIPAFSDVKVVDFQDDETLVVEPKH